MQGGGERRHVLSTNYLEVASLLLQLPFVQIRKGDLHTETGGAYLHVYIHFIANLGTTEPTGGIS